VWGVLNVTPDSFHDGGRHLEPAAALARGLALAAEGADVVDVGGESTRPGADPVPEAEERARVLPVIEALLAHGLAVPVSIDTRRAAVAEAALDLGARIVNDVSAGRDPDMLPLVARRGAGVVLMHMRGEPKHMQQDPRYGDVLAEVLAHLEERVAAARAEGVPPERIWIDPGIGFGKTLAHNLALLAALPDLVARGHRVLLGASRKSFLGKLTGREAGERLAGSLACAAHAYRARIAAVRVHDVRETRDLFTVLSAIEGSPRGGAREPE
jgi:dihydropteroate synthase